MRRRSETLGGSASWRIIGLKPLVGALLWASMQAVFAMPPAEEARVKRLIAQVGASEGTVFIRNGREHPAADAAEFLRRKCGGRLDGYADAEALVRGCASRSSTSGEDYRIRLAGETVARPSAEVLLRWLAGMAK